MFVYVVVHISRVSYKHALVAFIGNLGPMNYFRLLKTKMTMIMMIIANMAKACSILRLCVKRSGVTDGDSVGVVVGAGVGVSVGVGVGVIVGVGVGDGVVVDVVTVTKESRVAWSIGIVILGSLSMGG